MEKGEIEIDKKDIRNRELCALAKENDLQAQTQLILENEGIIVKLAKSFEVAYDLDINRYGGIELDDLLQEGRLAMLEAARTFRPEFDIKFSSFAYTVVKRRIMDLCGKGAASFECKLDDDFRTHVFLDDNPADEEGHSVSEKIQDGRVHDPAGDHAVLNVMVQKLYNRMDLLTARERKILIYHYFISEADSEPEAIKETAKQFHLTEGLVRKTEKDALEKLEEGMNDKKIL